MTFPVQLLLPLQPNYRDDGIPAWVVTYASAVTASHEPGMAAPQLLASSRMRRTLGSYSLIAKSITLNARLLALGSDDEIRLVLLHELAHAIAHVRSPRAPSHGAMFRQICRQIGARPSKYVDVGTRGWGERTSYAATCKSCRRDVIRKRRVASARCDCGVLIEPKRWNVLVTAANGATRSLGTSAPPGRKRYGLRWRILRCDPLPRPRAGAMLGRDN